MEAHLADFIKDTAEGREAEAILRTCVHCGFCTATCPTYQLLGDELDGPRGRIYLIKQMLEKDQAPTADVVKHIDRCLSCLSCMTTCPSGVHYMHLVDQARVRIEKTYRRSLTDRLLRYKYAPGDHAPTGPPEVLARYPDYGLNYKYGGWHLTRTIAFGAKENQGKLYISVGSSCNACDQGPL